MFGTAAVSDLLERAESHPTVIDRDAPVDGNVSPYEIDVIAALVNAHQPAVLFEIGTFDGRTSLNMAANAPRGATVYTLDLPAASLSSTTFALELNEDAFVKKQRSGARFVDSKSRYDIVQLLGDSATFDFSPYHGKVDFMFIDGSHAYAYVKSDTLNALKMVREGGIIIWHDFVRAGFTPFPGVPRALTEFYLTDARFRDLKQIQHTSIVYLKLPARDRIPPFRPILLGDSSRPDHLQGTLTATAIHVPDSPLKLKIIAGNTGSAAWLPSDAPVGPVRVGAKILDADGLLIDDTWRGDLPFRRTTFPGETVAFEAEITLPAGSHTLDLDLVADGVAWLDAERGPGISISEDVVAASLAQQVRVLKEERTRLLTALEAARREIDAVHASTSWRLTGPLRGLRRLWDQTAR